MMEVLIMRLIARIPDGRQVGALVDSLRNIGFDRKDMIISNMAEVQKYNNVEEATDAGMIFVKSEREGLGELEPFWTGIKGLEGDQGILVSLKTSKHDSDRVRAIMEQSGADEIVQD
jgi:hypothetical protein